MTYAVETFSISKQFPKLSGWRQYASRFQSHQPAVKQVSIQVKAGELFGLLGPNGAGKTTLIKMLSTLILPTSGSALVNGYDLTQDGQIKSSIGLVTSDERSFYWRLTGRQNLEFFAQLHAVPHHQIADRVNDVLDKVDLLTVADQRFLTYSTGMRQRLSIARALLNQPNLLFLDEPTKGIDPIATQKFHKLIKDQLKSELGVTIFLTTHNLEEAQALCDRIAIMKTGQIRACGTFAELQDELNLVPRYQILTSDISVDTRRTLTTEIPNIALHDEQVIPSSTEIEASESNRVQIEFYEDSNTSTLDKVIQLITNSRGYFWHISQFSPTLEHIFSHHIEKQVNTQEISATLEASTDTAENRLRDKKPSPPVTDASTFRSPTSFLRTARAFLIRDFRIETSYRFAFALQLMNILLSVGVFYFISLLIGPSATPYLSRYGGDYFSFVIIGIAFAGYFGVGLSSFSSSLRQSQMSGTLEAMLTSPTRLSAIIVSSSLWAYLMTTIRVLVYLIVGALIMGATFGQGNLISALVVLVLTIITFSSLGIISASFVMVLKRGDPIAWLFSAVSTFLGGVYYPITILPEGLQWLARLIPVTYALDAMRLALLQGASLNELIPQILALCVFSVILLPSSLFAFRFAVQRAKVEGSLTHY
jgi:ABC-2 type transport system permease protein